MENKNKYKLTADLFNPFTGEIILPAGTTLEFPEPSAPPDAEQVLSDLRACLERARTNTTVPNLAPGMLEDIEAAGRWWGGERAEFIKKLRSSAPPADEGEKEEKR